MLKLVQSESRTQPTAAGRWPVGAKGQPNTSRSWVSCTRVCGEQGGGCAPKPARASARAIAAGVVANANDAHMPAALHTHGHVDREHATRTTMTISLRRPVHSLSRAVLQMRLDSNHSRRGDDGNTRSTRSQSQWRLRANIQAMISTRFKSRSAISRTNRRRQRNGTGRNHALSLSIRRGGAADRCHGGWRHHCALHARHKWQPTLEDQDSDPGEKNGLYDAQNRLLNYGDDATLAMANALTHFFMASPMATLLGAAYCELFPPLFCARQ